MLLCTGTVWHIESISNKSSWFRLLNSVLVCVKIYQDGDNGPGFKDWACWCSLPPNSNLTERLDLSTTICEYQPHLVIEELITRHTIMQKKPVRRVVT